MDRQIAGSALRGEPGGEDRGLWRYALPGGWVVLAGRTDADNDRLSLRLASPKDYWFHVRGMPGSHVVLKVEDAEPPRETLRQAAAIAAWHSKARNAGTVSVSCTLAVNVSKPRGAPPGTVALRRETVIKTKPALPPTPAPG